MAALNHLKLSFSLRSPHKFYRNVFLWCVGDYCIFSGLISETRKMSGVSEASAAMMSREPFTETPSASQALLDQQMRVPYAADGTYRPVGASPPFQVVPSGGTPVAKQGMNLNSGEQKRKRGRPRKYGTDGSMAMVIASAPQPISVGMPQSPPSTAPPSTELVGGSASPTAKKPRGRPPGSSNKKRQIEAIGI